MATESITGVTGYLSGYLEAVIGYLAAVNINAYGSQGYNS